MDASTRFDTNLVGAMPVIVSYFDRVGFSQVIKDIVPWEGEVPLGELVEILMLNRLLNPKAMFRIGEWAEKTSVTEYFGLTSEQLNDDRLGRALERIAAHGDQVQAALVLNAIEEFGLKVNQIHYDITSIELYGSYETDKDEPSSPQPVYGKTKSGRKNVKQIQQGLSVSADGGVPVSQMALDGNTAESKTHIANLKKLSQALPKQNLLYIADTKLDTAENLLNIAARKGKFICGGAFKPNLKDEYLKLRSKLDKIDYCSNSQLKWPKEKRDGYQGVETEKTITGQVDGREVRLKYRLIYVWSERKARDEAKTRERHIDKIRDEFDKIINTLNKFSLKTEAKIVSRLETAKSRYSEGKLFQYTLSQGKDGKFQLVYELDTKELARRKKLEGVFVLKTNISKSQSSLKKVLSLYRDQTQVEGRFRNLKGRLAVTPMFLKKPERMAGLLYVLVWALMVMALMERAVAQQLDGEPMYGLYPENRPSPSPTGKAMFERFETLSIVIIKHKGEVNRRLAELDSVQRKIVKLLGIPPDFLRTFKRRCGM